MNHETLQPGDRVRVLKAFVDWDQQKLEAGDEFVFCGRDSLDGGWHTLRFEGRVVRLTEAQHLDVLWDDRDRFWRRVLAPAAERELEEIEAALAALKEPLMMAGLRSHIAISMRGPNPDYDVARAEEDVLKQQEKALLNRRAALKAR